MANESKAGYLFTKISFLNDISSIRPGLPKFALLKMFKSVNGGKYLAWYLYNAFLYSFVD